MRWSIRYQLLILILVLFLAGMGISTLAVVFSTRKAIHGQVEAQLRHVARTLSEANFPLTQRVLDQVKDLSGAEFFLLKRPGQFLTTLDGLDADRSFPTDDVPQDWRNLKLGPSILVKSEPFLCASVRFRPFQGEGENILHILYPESRWRAVLWVGIQPSIYLGFVGIVGSVVLALLISHWLTRRIQFLQRQAQIIAEGDFRPMPLPRWNDELQDLALSINEMTSRLTLLQEAIRKTERLRLLGQVSGGLAHQIRNSVTGARLAVQVHAEECSGEEESLAVAIRQLALVEEKIQRFLHLGQNTPLSSRPCSLVSIINDAVTLYRPQCSHLAVHLHWQPPQQPITIQGDINQLGNLFMNVLGNAMEAAGQNGLIEIRVHTLTASSVSSLGQTANFPQPGFAVVEILDSGPGPPSHIGDQLFEEFVTSKPEGVGLGLAVARQVAQDHGGRIEWSRDKNRTCFRIMLPLSPEEKPQQANPMVN